MGTEIKVIQLPEAWVNDQVASGLRFAPDWMGGWRELEI